MTADMHESLTVDNLFTLLGGLGLFLFGIKSMGEGLKALAGERLRDLINKYTTNRFAAVLTGALSTVAIQSSSGTTALTISLVRAGLMNLRQAIGIIMGANIGTTITSFVYALNVKALALPIIFIGAVIYMFTQKRTYSLVAHVIFGFGLLFYGLTVMEGPLKALAATDGFEHLMHSVAETPLLGVVIGTLLTMVVQSSSATIVILQGLYATGAFGFDIAFAILLGDNIGTTITSLLASIGGSKDSVRAAISHLLFNVIGSFIYFIIMYPLGFITAYGNLLNNITDDLKLQIFYAHFFFNASVTFVLIWFINPFEKLVKIIIPESAEEHAISVNEHYLDDALIYDSPSLALSQAKDSVIDMADLTLQQLNLTANYIDLKNKNDFSKVDQFEIAINSLDKKLKVFLRDLSAAEMSEQDSKQTNYYMYTINDIERIANLNVNIAHKYNKFIEKNEKLSEQASKEIYKMITVAISIVKSTKKLLTNEDDVIAGSIFEKEKHLDRMERKYYKQHLVRVKNGECTGRLSISYVDLLSDIERIGDHAQNIAEYYTKADEILTNDEKEIDITEFINEDM